MDITTIVGFLVAMLMIFMAIASGMSNFVDTPSLLIVIGGGTAATVMSIPLTTIKKAVGILASAFKEKKSNARQLVATMVKFKRDRTARRDPGARERRRGDR